MKRESGESQLKIRELELLIISLDSTVLQQAK